MSDSDSDEDEQVPDGFSPIYRFSWEGKADRLTNNLDNLGSVDKPKVVVENLRALAEADDSCQVTLEGYET